jgi:hypothetical protein
MPIDSKRVAERGAFLICERTQDAKLCRYAGNHALGMEPHGRSIQDATKSWSRQDLRRGSEENALIVTKKSEAQTPQLPPYNYVSVARWEKPCRKFKGFCFFEKLKGFAVIGGCQSQNQRAPVFVKDRNAVGLRAFAQKMSTGEFEFR